MPDRILRSSAGVLGGLTIILGLTYLWLGITWVLAPTETRLAGIEWAGLAAHLVGTWWIIGGAAAIIGGAWSRHALAAAVGASAAMVTPAVVAALFMVSMWHGNTRGIITAGSYLPYGVIAAWVTWRSSRVPAAALHEMRAAAATRARGGGAHGGA